MKHILYPGSFNPITNGHIDLIQRASNIFDHITIVICVNDSKKDQIDPEHKKQIIISALKEHNVYNASVLIHTGLLIDCCKQQQIDVILRGIRNITDFEYEFQMLEINRSLYDQMETIFMAPSAETSFVSSSMVRTLRTHDLELIRNFVPNSVYEYYLTN